MMVTVMNPTRVIILVIIINIVVAIISRNGIIIIIIVVAVVFAMITTTRVIVSNTLPYNQLPSIVTRAYKNVPRPYNRACRL